MKSLGVAVKKKQAALVGSNPRGECLTKKLAIRLSSTVAVYLESFFFFLERKESSDITE